MADVYPNQKVWAYQVGGDKFFADPMVVWHRFMEAAGGDAAILVERAYPPKEAMPPPVGPNIPQLPQQSDGQRDTVVAGARIEIGSAMIHALELQPFDRKSGQGVTASDGERLFLEWNEWMDEKKNPSAGSPTPSTVSPATGSPAPWATKPQ